MKLVVLRIVLALFVCSCSEGLIGGVAVGTVAFAKNDFHFFPSKEVYVANKMVKREMKKSMQSPRNVKIIQDGKVVYATGMVPSTVIKNRLKNVLDKNLKSQYVDEIQVTTQSRNAIVDWGIEKRIGYKLLFTKFVRSGNYNIVVFNQRAFIFGQVKNIEEKEIVIKALSQIEYIDDIIAYITTI